MVNLSNIGLTAIGGGLYTYGVTLFEADFYRGLILVGVGIVAVIAAAILNKKGYPVGRGK